MYGRPAGMSDDEFDDNDNFFEDEDIVPNYQNTNKSPISGGELSTEYFDNSQCNNEEAIVTSVINACITGHLEVIEEYLKSHDVNEPLRSGWTLLLYASSSIQPEIIQYLLEHEADPNKHKDGFTPLMAICTSRKGTPGKCLASLQSLLKLNVNADVYNKQRETALMHACRTKNVEFVTELLKCAKNINATDSYGRTALMYAVTSNKPDIVQVLLENNADHTIKNNNGISAKMLANTGGNEEIIKLLKTEEDEIYSPEVSTMHTWKDLFPKLMEEDKHSVHFDIAGILYGMGLDSYARFFQGMDLYSFLQLTEEDLSQIGIDISVHRKQFMDCLHLFHAKRWNVQSLGRIDKTTDYTIYNGVLSLGTAAKQIGVIESSFKYIKKRLFGNIKNESITENEKSEYVKELEKAQKSLLELKNELSQIKHLARKIDKENTIGPPATYICCKRNKKNWTVTLSISIMALIFLSRTALVRSLW